MEVMALVRDVNETLATIKGNVKRTSEVLAAWVANPMFDRKEGKVCFLSCQLSSLVNTIILFEPSVYKCTQLSMHCLVASSNQPLSLYKFSFYSAEPFYCCLLVMTQDVC